MLHQGLEIEGGKVYLPSSLSDSFAIVHTRGAVWAWDTDDGSYIKITIEDGTPKTEAYASAVKEEPEAFKVKFWSDR